METIEQLLARIKTEADERGVYLRPPLPEAELQSLVSPIRFDLGLEIPDDYLRLLRVTNGIWTQNGYLSDLADVGEQNAAIWFMKSESGTDEQGNFAIRYEVLAEPRTPTYLWLGYDGNSAEQVYDLASSEYRQLVLGGTETPLNQDRSLVGLLRHMVYGRDSASPT